MWSINHGSRRIYYTGFNAMFANLQVGIGRLQYLIFTFLTSFLISILTTFIKLETNTNWIVVLIFISCMGVIGALQGHISVKRFIDIGYDWSFKTCDNVKGLFCASTIAMGACIIYINSWIGLVYIILLYSGISLVLHLYLLLASGESARSQKKTSKLRHDLEAEKKALTQAQEIEQLKEEIRILKGNTE